MYSHVYVIKLRKMYNFFFLLQSQMLPDKSLIIMYNGIAIHREHRMDSILQTHHFLFEVGFQLL